MNLNVGCVLVCLCLGSNDAKSRTYFLSASEIIWDYAPPDDRTLFPKHETSELLDAIADPPQIGRKYKKAVFRSYTDETFAQPVPRQQWMGILGPIIRAQVGDDVIIRFWNNATRNYTLHPHGVVYNKYHEGALYSDQTSGAMKMDDAVPPGGKYTYHWMVRPDYGPTQQDTPCLTWPYHSHIHTENDINSGLIGALLVCKPGILDDEGQRTDVDHEYTLLFNIFDENLSYYLAETTESLLGQALTEELKEEKRFQESNKKHSINGLVYGSLRGLDFCVGDKISWHLLAMGSEADLHSVLFEGQTMLQSDHRINTVTLFPAKTTTVLMEVNDNVGQWLLSCNVLDHRQGGMETIFNVRRCRNSSEGTPSSPTIREYFVLAREVLWDYAPTAINQFNGQQLTDDEDAKVFFEKSPQRIGGQYKKAVFVGHSDDSFSRPLAKEVSFGLLGPLIQAEEGDLLRVTFFNNASRSYSIQPMSVIVAGNQTRNPLSRAVPPGQRFTYEWALPSSVTPTKQDSSCNLGLYHSSVVPLRDLHSGLIGPMLLCKKGSLNKDPKQTKDLFLLFSVINENHSHYLKDNIEAFCSDPPKEEDEDFQESNKMHAINGRMFGNLDGLEVCLNDNVTWYLMAVGDSLDLHTAYFYGNTFTNHNSRGDAVPLVPQSLQTVSMIPDNAGKWAVGCHTNDHYLGGMKATYTVEECQNEKKKRTPPTTFHGQVRVYYVAAVERDWDYAPQDHHIITGEKISENEHSKLFYIRDSNHIGHIYKKAVFREFTDSTFQQEKEHPLHLALLGPFLKVEVGDKVQVFFKNMASRSYGIHANGVVYNNTEEETKSVSPGETHLYRWTIAERSGPADDDPSCITWLYYSDVDIVKDTNSGLVGPLIVCSKGKLQSSGKRIDVEEEFALLFTITDENLSWYLEENIQKYLENPKEIDRENEDFQESNKMHGINGRIYGNLNGITMNVGDRIAYYLLGMGSEADLHTVHWHGNTVLRHQNGVHREDVTELFPGHVHTVESIATINGTWLLHCHVNDHNQAGMTTTFQITHRKRKLSNLHRSSI